MGWNCSDKECFAAFYTQHQYEQQGRLSTMMIFNVNQEQPDWQKPVESDSFTLLEADSRGLLTSKQDPVVICACLSAHMALVRLDSITMSQTIHRWH
jgi:hypothetical protein